MDESEDQEFIGQMPSTEQLQIIQAISNGQNVICDSVAGSGKTTTILNIAHKNKHLNILQLTYNARLKSEVRNKVRNYDLDNVEVHSYHSLNLNYYGGDHTDNSIILTAVKDKPLIKKERFDVIIVDEVQDMTANYYNLIKKFVLDTKNVRNSKYLTADNNTSQIQLLFMGDSRQCIYGYKGANASYLSEADKYWPDHEFVRLYLTTSYRLTREIAEFVNICMLGTNLIKTVKSSQEKVRYVAGNKPKKDVNGNYDFTFGVYTYLINLIETEECQAEDIFVLMPTVKDTNTGKASESTQLINNLSQSGIQIYKATDDERYDDKFANGKLVISTYHAVKGLERPIVIMYKFCEEYFTYYARDLIPTVCPSTLYVGATRASKNLIIYQSGTVAPFLETENIEDVCNVIGDIYTSSKPKIDKLKSIPITRLITHLSASLMYEIDQLLPLMFEEISGEKEKVNLSTEIRSLSGNLEHVSDLNGLAIIGKYEEETTGKCSITLEGLSIDNDIIKKAYETLINIYKNKKHDMKYYLNLANINWCNNENHIYRLNQIKSYTWLDDLDWEKIKFNLKDIPGDLVYEQDICRSDRMFAYKRSDGKIICLSGTVDSRNSNTIIEFKCTSELKSEHKLQLIFYAFMIKTVAFSSMEKWDDINFNLINARTGENLKLKNDILLIEKVCVLIMNTKSITNITLDEDHHRNIGSFIKDLAAHKAKVMKKKESYDTINIDKLKKSEGMKGYKVKELQEFCKRYKVDTKYCKLKTDYRDVLLKKIQSKN